MNTHKEKLIKVNAWVDIGVVPLVEALNEFSEILTLDSCEGYDNNPNVWFRCKTEGETVEFAFRLIKALRTQLNEADAFDFKLGWVGTGEPLIQIITPKHYLDTLVSALTAIRTSSLMTLNAENLAV